MRRISIAAALFLGATVACAAMDRFDELTATRGWGIIGMAAPIALVAPPAVSPASPRAANRPECTKARGRITSPQPACPARERRCSGDS